MMKQTYEDDLTKALRCLGSQDAEGGCYEDLENLRRWESGERLLMCAENPVGKERCPYHQPTYSCCFEDGECMEWLGEAADEIVSQRKELEGRGNVAQKEDLHGSDEGCAFPASGGGGQCEGAGKAERGKQEKYTVRDFQMEEGDGEVSRVYCD